LPLITNKDIITQPYESYFLIEGRLTKADDDSGSYADTDKVTLANNGLMYLFN
jgi:hypothetical protein